MPTVTATLPAGWRALDVTLDGERSYPAVVRLDNGSQPMTDTHALGWAGNPIPRWNGWVAFPLFDREAVEAMRADFDAWRTAEIERWGSPESDVLRWDGDTVLIDSAQYAAEPGYTPERIDGEIGPDGVMRWCVGGCSWTWAAMDDE